MSAQLWKDNGDAAEEVVQALYRAGMPFDQLCAHPVTAIESMTAVVEGVARPACGVGCLACCAEAVRPHEATAKVFLMTPELIAAVLAILEALSNHGVRVVSTERLNLFSGSNELDNPGCMAIREQVSHFMERCYGTPLGRISSDLAFHVSNSGFFERNLRAAMDRPFLWDNMCFSIDEQLPWRNRQEYERYREKLAFAWDTIRPALTGDAMHSNPRRAGYPRVIVNLIVPPAHARFAKSYVHLYPGGPLRALTYQELAKRYVQPYVGRLAVTPDAVPARHVFTTAVAALSGLPGSRVYLSENRYMVTERGENFVQLEEKVAFEPRAIRTKIMPVAADRVAFKACFTTSTASEDEIRVPQDIRPKWFEVLEQQVVDCSRVMGAKSRK